ncbi:MAG: galactokinase, partial [Opitutales bacterium]|nr:galactokinase [Opitutales bacterium]
MVAKTAVERFAKYFEKEPQVSGIAPGRIEFVGNHTDYNGGFVMGVAIDKSIAVAVSKRGDKKICFANAMTGEKVWSEIGGIKPLPRALNWANYPLGVFKYMLEAGMRADCGFDMTDASDLPHGAGVSSSAAIEMSACAALAKLYNFPMQKKDMVRVCRKSENLFLNMPCGILDQGVSGFGKKNSAVFIDCKSEEFETLPLPQNCKFYLFNSTKKHALVDGLYAARHGECMEAANVLSSGGEERLLREFSISDLEAKKGEMSQNAYKRARHVIEENERVLAAKKAMMDFLAKDALVGTVSNVPDGMVPESDTA